MEVMVREYAQPDGNFIWIVWDKDSTVEFRPLPHCSYAILSSILLAYARDAFTFMLLKSIYASAGRCSTMIHDVPESKMLETLKEYGIQADMLPTSMGGTIELNAWIAEFIAQRRAVEMEEL